jgi:hypothetical protein
MGRNIISIQLKMKMKMKNRKREPQGKQQNAISGTEKQNVKRGIG